MTSPSALSARITPIVPLVIINYIGWRIGVFLDRYGGDIDQLGAGVCRTTYSVGFFLIFAAIIYTFLRRFVLQRHQWDFYGPALAALSFFFIYFEEQASVLAG